MVLFSNGPIPSASYCLVTRVQSSIVNVYPLLTMSPGVECHLKNVKAFDTPVPLPLHTSLKYTGPLELFHFTPKKQRIMQITLNVFNYRCTLKTSPSPLFACGPTLFYTTAFS